MTGSKNPYVPEVRQWQFGALACSGGVGACKKVIADLERFMDKNGYRDMDSLCGDA